MWGEWNVNANDIMMMWFTSYANLLYRLVVKHWHMYTISGYWCLTTSLGANFFYEPSAHITSFIPSFFFVVLLLHLDQSAIMNDPVDFGFGDISPNTLEAEQQQEQQPEQETNDPDNFGFGDISPNALEAEHQQEQEQQPEQETNDLDDFGFGDISPNTLEAEHQQGQEHDTNTQRVLVTPP